MISILYFPEVTRQQVDFLQLRLVREDRAVVTPAPVGDPNLYEFTVSTPQGIDTKVVYSIAERRLCVEVTKKPFFVPIVAISDGLRDGLAEALVQSKR